MSNKFKGAMFFAAGMAILLYGFVAIIGYGTDLKDAGILMVWAIAYGGLMAGSAHYDGKAP
jgi:hypothetical protein